jgi:antirestriction protein ArdC
MTDAFSSITESIVSAIAGGPAKTELPWHRSALQIPWNVVTNRPYHGINVLSLWIAAASNG